MADVDAAGSVDGAQVDLSMGQRSDGGPDLCMYSGQCDPECPAANLQGFVLCLFEPWRYPNICGCGNVGHRCGYFEHDLECGCDHYYHCAYSVPGGCQDAGLDSVRCRDGG